MTGRPSRQPRRALALASAGVLLLAAAVTGSALIAGVSPEIGSHADARSSGASHLEPRPHDPAHARIAEGPEPESVDPGPPALSPDEIAALPEARYNAVIAGLLDAAGEQGPPWVGEQVNFSLLGDAPIYGEDRTTPLARLAAVNFLGEPTVVVPVRQDGEWTLVLTPARQALPSAVGGNAPAQTTGWVRTDTLAHPRQITSSIVVDVAAQSLTIVDLDGSIASYAVGVGTPGTPTPTGTGYLQARYLDPAQGQTEHRVQLTSLHSSMADEPYGGTDGGLIGLHYSPESTGSVSHGCIRLSPDAARAVDALPLGTLITVL